MNIKKQSYLIGDPVEHSLSNYLYDLISKSVNYGEYQHLKVRIDSKDKTAFVKKINEIRDIKYVGANITIPYKLEVIKYLDEVDAVAKAIGAVNTIVNRNGKLCGYNTDGYGALMSIDYKLKKVDSSDSILIIGAGGAARAVIGSLSTRTKNITVLNRKDDYHILEKLVEDFQVQGIELKYSILDEESLIKNIANSNIIINATSLGMNHEDVPIVEEEIFKVVDKFSPIKNKFFFDVILNPYHTAFLKTANRFGAKVCSGLYMMIFQGYKSFELWTGISVNEENSDKIRDALMKYY